VTARKNVDVPICVVLFIFSTTQALMANTQYCSQEYYGVEPKPAVPPSQDPSIHPSAGACIGLGPISITDWAPFFVWVETVLPFTLDRKIMRSKCILILASNPPNNVHTLTYEMCDKTASIESRPTQARTESTPTCDRWHDRA